MNNILETLVDTMKKNHSLFKLVLTSLLILSFFFNDFLHSFFFQVFHQLSFSPSEVSPSTRNLIYNSLAIILLVEFCALIAQMSAQTPLVSFINFPDDIFTTTGYFLNFSIDLSVILVIIYNLKLINRAGFNTYYMHLSHSHIILTSFITLSFGINIVFYVLSHLILEE